MHSHERRLRNADPVIAAAGPCGCKAAIWARIHPHQPRHVFAFAPAPVGAIGNMAAGPHSLSLSPWNMERGEPDYVRIPAQQPAIRAYSRSPSPSERGTGSEAARAIRTDLVYPAGNPHPYDCITHIPLFPIRNCLPFVTLLPGVQHIPANEQCCPN